jgi:outer membrane protein OmpA-like peptidoglycan-associated protein
VWVDEENNKWVANSQGLYKVLAIDLVQRVSIPAGKTSLLDIRGGNAKIEWSTSEMQTIIGNANITCASYDERTKSLWVGTSDVGALQLSLDPLRVLQRFNMDNKRLTSNQINDIFIQSTGKVWIATNDGMLTGSGDKWTLEERYLNFIGVDAWGSNLWILGDDFLWQVDSKGKWQSIAIEPKNVEGQLRDIAVDDKGRVWIASNMMTGYDVQNNRYQRFGPGQYFTSQFVNCLDVDKDGSIWTGTDDKGLYLIQWEAAMTVNVLMDTPLDCKTKANTAALSVKVTGGTAPLTYLWSNGQTAEKINMLGPGKYAITVSDSKGIVKSSKYEIPDPNFKIKAELITASTGKADGDGSANLIIDGGAAPLTYKWDNGETQQTAIKLTTGDHTVTVTDASGCSNTTTIAITEKTTSLNVFAKFVSENKCAEAKDGIAEVDVTGGKAPYTYKWSPGNATTSKIENLGAGLYSVTVTDAKGQTASTSVNIPAPSPLVLSASMITLAAVNTNNGIGEAKVSGGKPPYTYKWDTGEATSKVTTLSAGGHSVTITDSNGCSASASLNVQENINALGVIVKQPVRISCHGAGGAALKVDITGGKPPYTYKWSDGQTTATAEKLNAGKYTITVTDVLGNAFSSEFIINEPEAITITTTVDAPATPNNADGKATAKASGGTGTLTYTWDNGERANKAIKLNLGTHRVTVTDASGCSATGEVTVSENISELQLTIEQTAEVKCAGGKQGTIKAVIKGGKSPFTYHWGDNETTPELTNVPDGVYKLTITDAAGQMATSVITVFSPPALTIDAKADLAASTGKSDGRGIVTATGGTGKYMYQWDNGETVAKAITLNAGKHTVTVTDVNGCTATAEINTTENILPVTVKITQDKKILCAGATDASLVSSVSGGKPPYVYTWKSNANTFSGESISNLAPGKYALTVTDASNLSGTAEITITEPKPLELSIDEITPASTNNADGKVILRANGGTAQYTLDGSTIPAGTNTFTIDRLKAGDHLLIVNDAAGCSAQLVVKIPENVLPLTTTIKQVKEILCHENSDGALEAIVKGGKPPLTYAWSNGEKQASISNLKEGSYTVTVTDASGQSNKAEFTVKAPPAIQLLIANIRSATNDRINDGKSNVTTNGGTGSFTFQWSSGETDHQAVKLPIGPAYVIATDQNGCTAKSEFTINQKVLPDLTATRLATGEPIRIEKIQFAADSTNINPEAIPSLDELYDFLYDNPTIVIEVSGHTNGLPADDYCDRISSERAKSVADYIVSKGIEARRVISKGYGKRKPVATNQTAEGRKKNQRVEIKLIKIEE